jgi:hypothetical protein
MRVLMRELQQGLAQLRPRRVTLRKLIGIVVLLVAWSARAQDPAKFRMSATTDVDADGGGNRRPCT